MHINKQLILVFFTVFMFKVETPCELPADTRTLPLDTETDIPLIYQLIRNPEKLPWEKGNSLVDAEIELSKLGFSNFYSDPPDMLEKIKKKSFCAPGVSVGGFLSCSHKSGRIILRYRWCTNEYGMYLQDIIVKLPEFISWNNCYERIIALGYKKAENIGSSFLRKTIQNIDSGTRTVFQIQVRAYTKIPELLLVVAYREGESK